MSPHPSYRSIEPEPIAARMAAPAISRGFPCPLAEARHYLGGMMELSVGAAGGVGPALHRIARETDVKVETLKNIRRPDRLKSAKPSVVARLKAAYDAMCARQLAALQHRILLAQEANPDVSFDDIAAEIAALAARADARMAPVGERVSSGLRARGISRGARRDTHLNTESNPASSSSLPGRVG